LGSSGGVDLFFDLLFFLSTPSEESNNRKQSIMGV